MTARHRLKAIYPAAAANQRTGQTAGLPHLCVLFISALLLAAPAFADNARFDLIGPKIEVRVTRHSLTLPIAAVPNLQAGDRIWLHPDLPDSQSVRYLMVLAFLRGTTNPPPDNWFTRVETWDKKVRAEGVEVTVPDEAQQAVLFLAPVTGGDFATLRSAVQGRPGIFVRASQDLTAAGFEQARIEKYIASMRQLSPEEAADPKQLQEHSNLIAATLALKPNPDCVKLPPDQQYTCLMQTGSQSLLDDGHGQSIIDALTGGESAGLIGTASATQLAGGGVYSAYVGTIVDLVHIMGSLHTAQYQYIPAIAFPEQEALNLRLNTPPSFHNPKSVIVIGLPSVQKSIAPPLRAADPKQVTCLIKPGVVLPVEGAPLAFSTGFAHDLVLHLNEPEGTKPGNGPRDISLTADAFRGGLVLAPEEKRRALHDSPPSAANPTITSSAQKHAGANKTAHDEAEPALTGTIKGYWGFDPFTGPTLALQDAPGKDWHLVEDNSSGHWLTAGKDRHIELASTGAACVESIALEPGSGAAQSAGGQLQSATFKPAHDPNTLDVSVDISSHDAGAMHLAVRQFGAPKVATVAITAYSEPAKLDALYYHAGDTTAELAGTSLYQVRRVSFSGLSFEPAGKGSVSTQPNGKSELHLALARAASPTIAGAESAGKSLSAQVTLDDDRTLNLPFTIETARPSVALLSRADIAQTSHSAPAFAIKLGGQSDLPVGDALTFSLKSAQPFPRDASIEIASPDGSLHTRLSIAAGTLVLEDPHTLLATFEPLKIFGPSAFGPIQLRAVASDGTTGDWLPLATLVRLPSFNNLSCTSGTAPAQQSTQTGADNSSPKPDAATTPASTASSDAPSSASPQQPPSAATGAEQPASSDVPQPASCTLAGTGLYLIDSLAPTASFANPTAVPEGYVGATIDIPPPTGGTYYLRLRDDPAAIDTVTLPSGPLDHAAP